jgi:hypothetical protein
MPHPPANNPRQATPDGPADSNAGRFAPRDIEPYLKPPAN